MPELPEVESARKMALAIACGRTITVAAATDDPIVFEKTPPETIARVLRGRRVIDVHRHGKYFWFEFDRPPHLVAHFGMSGTMRTRGDEPLVLSSSPKTPDRSWPPRFCKLHLRFHDGGELALTDARRLGRIVLRDDPVHSRPLCALGPDALNSLPAKSAFAEMLGHRSGNIKGLLLNQTFLAGLGNWLVDEVLHAAKISPWREANRLSRAESDRLRQAILRIVSRAVMVDADSGRYPKRWLFHRRGDSRLDTQGRPLRREPIAGRTTVWDPTRQE